MRACVCVCVFRRLLPLFPVGYDEDTREQPGGHTMRMDTAAIVVELVFIYIYIHIIAYRYTDMV